ncbi:MAG TPA: beta-ketoacyl-[acyl-carrier-protein] synthase family protein [Thermoanaerobaculia bacterium]|nr:beta-ketoacyl-[acyl-carrier-protein] synthase family protein [Thermoanaerobaculia bacterium]
MSQDPSFRPTAGDRARAERAVLVTGIGAVSGFGWGVAVLRAGLRAGESAVRPPRRLAVHGHRTALAAEVPEGGPPGLDAAGRGLSRADRFALAAAREAVDQAGVEPLLRARPERVGVFFGGSTAGMAEAEGYLARVLGTSPGRPRLHDLVGQQLDAPGNSVARVYGVEGPVETVSSACASGGLAVLAALDAIRRGEIDRALAGGADSLCQLTYAGFNALRAVDPAPCRPFRADRAGLSLGEGAGVLVLESAASARERGARALARIAGAGASCDAHHMTAPHPEGEGAAAAIRVALEEGGRVALVHAHGTGTPLNDASEAQALRRALLAGEGSGELPPTTSVKGAIGHLLGSAGAIEAVATVLALLDGELQPTAGGGAADPGLGVDLVLGAPRAVGSGEARGLSTSFAFGGANVALVIATPEPTGEPTRDPVAEGGR